MLLSRRRALKSVVSSLGAGAFAWPAVAAVAAQTAGASVPFGGPVKVRLALIESLSGPFANTGESVYRNIVWALERGSTAALAQSEFGFNLQRYDSKGQVEEALSALRAAIDDGVQVVMQGNSSAVAAALIDAVNKHNQREPMRRVLYLNYSAVDPALTNEKCSPWHFRFDAHADMRLGALMSVLKDDTEVKAVYLFGQDYSFGQAVVQGAKRLLPALRPDVKLAGEELHPLGRVKDFAPYITKIKASGADAVITGNWGNDLTLLVKAAREAGYDGKFYTFYGNALGAPAAMGDAGVGKVLAVADWLPNLPTPESQAFYQSFKKRFPRPEDDYVHMRMQLMVMALAQSIVLNASPAPGGLAGAPGALGGVAPSAGPLDVLATRSKLAQARVSLAGQAGSMRAADGQFQQSLVVGVMDKLGSPGVKFDVEGSGYGFRVVKTFSAGQTELPHSCKMPLAA